MSPVHFTTGFQDSFELVANGQSAFGGDASLITNMFNYVPQYNARTMRFAVDWGRVETQPGVYDWSYYNNMIGHAWYRNLRLLPIVLGAPVSRPGVTFPYDVGTLPSGLSYPRDSAAYTAYGNFAAETLSYFGSAGVTRAIEIWNEPNLAKYLGIDAEYKKILNAALAATRARAYSFPYTVISGGLALGQSGWESFMDDFTYYNQCFTPYAVGIHPYAYTQNAFPASMSRTLAVGLYVNAVTQLYQRAHSHWTGDIWVTEFGCPAVEPFGRIGKSNALQQLVGQGGSFDLEPLCKGVMLYRLMPQTFLHDDTTPGSGFYSFPLLTQPDPGVFSFQMEAPVSDMLAGEWAGAPFVP